MLRVESSVQFGAGAQVSLRVGSAPGLVVTGTATLAGGVRALVEEGTALAEGAVFDALQAGVIAGTFTNAVAAAPGHLYEFNVGYGAKKVTLTAHALGLPPIQISATRVVDQALQFEVAGVSGLTYVIESSGDFVSWQTVLTAPAPPGTLTFTAPIQPQTPHLFYRFGVLP